MYAFQESLPASRPPPVSFSPPKAPPISAPLVPMLTLAMPQSLPAADRNLSASLSRSVKMAEESPCGTLLWMAIASSSVLNVRTYRIGANGSHETMFMPGLVRIIVGWTK